MAIGSGHVLGYSSYLQTRGEWVVQEWPHPESEGLQPDSQPKHLLRGRGKTWMWWLDKCQTQIQANCMAVGSVGTEEVYSSWWWHCALYWDDWLVKASPKKADSLHLLAAAIPSPEPQGTEGALAPFLGQHHLCRDPAAVLVWGMGSCSISCSWKCLTIWMMKRNHHVPTEVGQ